MMVLAPATSPREFGAALRAARENRGVPIEMIADRTKIARRVLELLEAGDFAKLPNRVFVRLFLQQYLALVGEQPERWIPEFEATWQRFEDASQPWEVSPPVPSHGARWLPWVVGIAVVVGGLIAVVLVERRPGGEKSPATVSAPARVLPTPLPATAPPVETAATPAATASPDDVSVLVLRTTDRPCWVEVRVEGARSESRLLAAGTEWHVPAGGRPVNLVVGDGGALHLEYLGERREKVGADGTVVHLRLGSSPAAAGPTP
jgi:cytoskeleton protein RodZ